MGLTCVHQNLDQLPEEVAAAMFANAGSLVSFAVGGRDAEPLAEQFAGKVMPQDLIRLPQFHCYVRLLVNGQPTRPFSMQTVPLPALVDPHSATAIRHMSQRRFGRPKEKVDADVAAAYAA